MRNEPNPALQHENTATCCHGLVLTVLYSDTFGKRNKADQTDEAHERRHLSRSYQKRGVERLYRVSQRAEQFAAQCHLQPDLLSWPTSAADRTPTFSACRNISCLCYRPSPRRFQFQYSVAFQRSRSLMKSRIQRTGSAYLDCSVRKKRLQVKASIKFERKLLVPALKGLVAKQSTL